MWSAEAGNRLEARVGVGKTGKLGGGGGRKAAVSCPKPGTRVTLNSTPDIFCHPSPEILDTAPNPRLGGGVGEGRSPDSSHQEVREEIPPRPWPEGGRKAGWSAELCALLPGVPQRPPSLLGRPFPPSRGEEEAPARVSHFSSPEKGPHRARKTEQRRPGGSRGQEAGRGLRGGVLRLHGSQG